ncbi:MAG: rfaP [Verrucomicrobiaceae bacterium]|nr:rfaP [Verrucomicrobiaceae bacterium]
MSDSRQAWLRADLAQAWGETNPFAAAQAQQGTVYREKEGRRTLSFNAGEKSYFLKLHQGVGWKEIIKNLLQGRLPILGASNEYNAIRALEKIDIDTLTIAGYGKRGLNPAQQLSFLVTDELKEIESLEDFCKSWPQHPPSFSMKQQLIERLADISRKMHVAGINHRDYYLCHFLLDMSAAVSEQNIASKKLSLMDLHRAQIRARVPQRWVIKDLGGLYFSALDIGLTKRDIFRFMRYYRQKKLREILRSEARFWRKVAQRAGQIYTRDNSRQPSSAAWIDPAR